MKIGAITGKGTKKDFIDIYFLMKHYKLEQMLHFFEQKYPTASTLLALKSLSYFVDVDKNEMPKMFFNVSWKDIKENIKITLKEYLTSS